MGSPKYYEALYRAQKTRWLGSYSSSGYTLYWLWLVGFICESDTPPQLKPTTRFWVETDVIHRSILFSSSSKPLYLINTCNFRSAFFSFTVSIPSIFLNSINLGRSKTFVNPSIGIRAVSKYLILIFPINTSCLT